MSPQKYISEGDTPAFLNLVNNGLEAEVDYTLGGWGGRGVFDDSKFPKHLTDKNLMEDGDNHKMFWRWVPAAQNDFAARMDWCVNDYAHANHAPIVDLQSNIRRKGKPGETVRLAAVVSDPDGNKLASKWWQYGEADSVKETVQIANADSANQASFVVPNEPGKQVQIILEVTDDGTPQLTSYRRLLFTID